MPNVHLVVNYVTVSITQALVSDNTLSRTFVQSLRPSQMYFSSTTKKWFISLLSFCVIFPLNNNRLEDDKTLFPSSYLPFPTHLDVFHPPILLVRHIHYSSAPVVSDFPVVCSRILVIYLVQWYLPAPKRSAASPPVKHPRNIATKEKTHNSFIHKTFFTHQQLI